MIFHNLLSVILLYFIPITSLIGISWLASKANTIVRYLVAYSLFFTTPILTLSGAIGPLTGFNAVGGSGAYFGISFLTPFLALCLIKQTSKNLSFKALFITAANPVYMSCGPIPRSPIIRYRINWRNFWRRFSFLQRDLILGLFFISTISPAFSKLLSLKSSTQAADVIFFGLSFELYVYFNFFGYSLISYSILRSLGFDITSNFNSPFSAKTVVDYWHRWHRSLSYVLKTLFFDPLKSKFGLTVSALATFLASAVWHGVSVNFVIWGVFHAACWSISRWLYLNKHTFLQIPLLIITVIIGRILFSESDVSLIFLKLQNLFSIDSWGEFYFTNQLANLTSRDLFHIFLGFLLILSEIFIGKNNFIYMILKKPTASTIIMSYIVLFGAFNDSGGAIYGNR